MESGASRAAIPEDDDWGDDDWEEDYDDDSVFSGISFGIKPILATAFVILILICAMVFQNFGFYFGAGNLTVLIDVNEGKDPGDRTLDANIWAIISLPQRVLPTPICHSLPVGTPSHAFSNVIPGLCNTFQNPPGLGSVPSGFEQTGNFISEPLKQSL